MKNYTHNLLNTPTAIAHKAAHTHPGLFSSAIPTSVMTVVGGVVGVTVIALSFMVFAVAYDIDASVAHYSVTAQNATVAMVSPQRIASFPIISEQGRVLGVTTKKIVKQALSESRVLTLIDEKIQGYILDGYLRGQKGDKGTDGINGFVPSSTQYITPAPLAYVSPAPSNNGNSFVGSIFSAVSLSASNFSADKGSIAALTVGQNISIGGVGYTWPTSQSSSATYLSNDGAGKLSWSTIAGSGTVQSGSSGYFGYYPSAGATITDQSILNLRGSNIGIGTITPTATLYVKGSGATNPFVVASSSGIQLFTISTNGNIGIGTSAPQEKFHVATGNILLSGTDKPVRIGSNGSDGGVVFVSGKYMYRGGNTTFSIYDISNPAVPVLISATTTNINFVANIVVSGKYAYVTSMANNSFLVFDVSNPSAIVSKAVVTSGLSNPSGLYVSGKYAYVTNYTTNVTDRKLLIFDISNPSNVIAMGTTTTNLNAPTSVYVQGKYAYVGTDSGNSLVSFDVSNPNNIVQVGIITSGLSSIQSVYVSGRYAYLASAGNGSLIVVDISNPASMVVTGSTTTNLFTPFAVYVSGRYAYVADDNRAVSVFDVSNPASIVAVATKSSSVIADHIFVSGKYLYLGDFTNGVEIYRLNNTDTPTLVSGEISTAHIDVTDNAIIGNNLFVQSALNVGSGGALIGGDLSVQGTGNSYFAGNVGIGTTTPALGPLVMASGAYVTTGGAWTNSSDRNKKENFTPVNALDVLEKINSLSITRWNYKTESASTTHVGPVAQDFYAAFHTGDSDTSISTIDPAGLALVGIQGLSQRINSLQGGLNGNASTSQLSVTQPVVYQNTLAVYKQVTFSEDTVGQAKIISGSTLVRVIFSQTYATLPIVTITPHEYVESKYKISNVNETGFTIEIQSGQGLDVVFDWHAFASYKSKLFVSDGTTQLLSLQINPSPVPAFTPVPIAASITIVTPDATSTPESTSTPPIVIQPVTPSTTQETVTATTTGS